MACIYRTLLVGLLGLSVLAVASASARTWYVEKDGSGEFAVIQDAVDAASSGDVIAVGPGRYDDYQTVQGGAYFFDIHVLVPDGFSLSFTGAGVGVTIIGPADTGSHENRTYGIAVIGDIGLSVRSMSFENCSQYSIGTTTGVLDVADCEFVYEGDSSPVTRGIDGRLSASRISHCRFTGFHYGLALRSFDGTTSIEDCIFENCTVGVYGHSPGQGFVSVSDCDFYCDLAGIGFLDGTSGSIECCRLENCILELTNTAEVTVANCEVTRTDGNVALDLRNADPVTIVDSIFRSNGVVVYLGSLGLGTIRNNHFLRTGGDYWVYCPYHPSFQHDIDLSGNYWGTTDVEEIAEGIWDCQDDDHAYHCVSFEPIADGPVRVESVSWSSVKGLFGGAGEE